MKIKEIVDALRPLLPTIELHREDLDSKELRSLHKLKQFVREYDERPTSSTKVNKGVHACQARGIAI